MSSRRQFTRGALVAFALHVGAMGTLFGAQLVYANWLSQGAFGVFAQAVAAALVAANLLILGVPLANLQLLPNFVANEDWARWRGMVRWGMRRAGGAALLVGAGWSVIAAALGVDPAWTLAGLALPALVVIGVQQTHALAFKDVVLARLPSEIGRPALALGLFLAAGLVGLEPSAATAMGALLLAAVAVAGLLAGLLHRLPPARAHASDPVEEPARWGPIANQFLGANFFAIVMDRADILVVGAISGAEAAAVYAVITSLGKLLLFALAAVNTIGAPMISDLHQQQRPEEVRALLRTGVGAATVLALLGIGFFALFAEPVLALFGPGYPLGTTALFLLLVGYAANAACGSAGLIVSMTGHQHITWRVIAGSAGLMLLLDLALVPTWGIEGAAVARSVAMVAWNLVLAGYAIRRLDYNPTVLSWLRRPRT